MMSSLSVSPFIVVVQPHNNKYDKATIQIHHVTTTSQCESVYLSIKTTPHCISKMPGFFLLFPKLFKWFVANCTHLLRNSHIIQIGVSKAQGNGSLASISLASPALTEQLSASGFPSMLFSEGKLTGDSLLGCFRFISILIFHSQCKLKKKKKYYQFYRYLPVLHSQTNPM